MPLLPLAVRLEAMRFLTPVRIGEVATATARTAYTSERSLLVTVHVWAEDVLRASRRLSNIASVWYVCSSAETRGDDDVVVLPMPPLTAETLSDRAMWARGQALYAARPPAHPHAAAPVATSSSTRVEAAPGSPAASVSDLIHVIHPSDCSLRGFLYGGVTLKLMDNVAGVCAARHVRGGVVTAGIDPINLVSPARVGELVHAQARVNFCSARSMEIDVRVWAESLGGYRLCSQGLFTMVAMGPGGIQPVPALVPLSDADRAVEAEGRARYMQRKAERAAAAAAAAATGGSH